MDENHVFSDKIFNFEERLVRLFLIHAQNAQAMEELGHAKVFQSKYLLALKLETEFN